MPSRPAAVTLALLASLALAGPAAAQGKKVKKPRPACDLTYLPFTPGAQWTYAFFAAADVPPGVHVKDPDSFTVKVVGIAKDGADTVIKLEERYRKVVVATELRCGKDGLMVPPESFFFAGEPGGGVSLALKDLVRVGPRELPGRAEFKAGAEVFAEYKAAAVRTPTAGVEAKLAGATIEVERKAVVGASEDVESKLGNHAATRVEVSETGRALLEGQAKDRELNMQEQVSQMWFATGIGVVRVVNGVKGWQLAEHLDGSEPPAVPVAPAAPAAPAP